MTDESRTTEDDDSYEPPHGLSFHLSEVNIWTVDGATIRARIRERNRIRAAALLPLVDERREFENACGVIWSARWRAFCDRYKDDLERFKEQVVAERGPPRGWIVAGSHYDEAWRRFKAFLHAKYADNIAALFIIAPDYLAITRTVTERIQEDVTDEH